MIYEKIRDLVAKQFVVDADSLSRETSFNRRPERRQPGRGGAEHDH